MFGVVIHRRDMRDRRVSLETLIHKLRGLPWPIRLRHVRQQLLLDQKPLLCWQHLDAGGPRLVAKHIPRRQKDKRQNQGDNDVPLPRGPFKVPENEAAQLHHLYGNKSALLSSWVRDRKLYGISV